jgi:hypothetical protein
MIKLPEELLFDHIAARWLTGHHQIAQTGVNPSAPFFYITMALFDNDETRTTGEG